VAGSSRVREPNSTSPDPPACECVGVDRRTILSPGCSCSLLLGLLHSRSLRRGPVQGGSRTSGAGPSGGVGESAGRSRSHSSGQCLASPSDTLLAGTGACGTAATPCRRYGALRAAATGGQLWSVALPVSLPASFWSNVDRIALCVHRPSASSADFRRVVDRLEIPAGSFVVSAARHIAAGRVTLEQLQLLGRYESRTIIELNAKRHVELGFFHELDQGAYAPTEQFRSASRSVLDLQARAAEDLWADTTDLAELAASAASVVATVAPPVPAPAFSAQRADHAVTPASAAGQLLAFVTELRYLRSDLHAHALGEHGFYGPTARCVDRAWKSHRLPMTNYSACKTRDSLWKAPGSGSSRTQLVAHATKRRRRPSGGVPSLSTQRPTARAGRSSTHSRDYQAKIPDPSEIADVGIRRRPRRSSRPSRR
jgi:hypothetical protein